MEVRVSEIEKELRKLWEQDDARTNASLVNLVMYSEKRGSLAEHSGIAAKLTLDHACRVILVEIDRAVTEPSLRAWITAHCHLSQGRKSVCCEQIAFRLTGRVTGRFRNTVFSHLESDLPLVFWWHGELSDVLTERLASVIDRLIVDSRDWKNPAASFSKLEEAARVNIDLIIQDHAWTRTWQFRLGIASIFDDPAAARALSEMNEVAIEYCGRDRNSMLQLLTWLQVQAGWKKAGELRFSRPGGAIAIRLVELADGPPIASVTMKAPDFTGKVRQDPGEELVRRSIETSGYHVASVSPADTDTREELLTAQLARGGKNTLFRKVLPVFREMLETMP